MLWIFGGIKLISLLVAGWQLCSLFHFGKAQAAAGNAGLVNLNLLSIVALVLCAYFPNVRSVVTKYALAPAWKGLKKWGAEVEEASK